jgi:hypothetical protein
MKMYIKLNVSAHNEYEKSISKIYGDVFDIFEYASGETIQSARYEADVDELPVSKIATRGVCRDDRYGICIKKLQEVPDEFLSSDIIQKMLIKNIYTNSCEHTINTDIETIETFCDTDYTVHKNETTGEVSSVSVMYKFNFIKFLQVWAEKDFPENFVH